MSNDRDALGTRKAGDERWNSVTTGEIGGVV